MLMGMRSSILLNTENSKFNIGRFENIKREKCNLQSIGIVVLFHFLSFYNIVIPLFLDTMFLLK